MRYHRTWRTDSTHDLPSTRPRAGVPWSRPPASPPSPWCSPRAATAATTPTAGAAADAGGGGDEPSIDLVQPADGDGVGDTFDVEVDTGVELGEPDTSLHHVHLYYDGETADGEYDLVYGTTFTVEHDLGPGEHTVEAVVANADHGLTDARDEVTVTVDDGLRRRRRRH